MKLDHQKLGPFEIEEQLGLVGYKLKLLKSIKIHLNFHILLLEKAPDDAETPDNMELNKNTTKEEYEVKRILQMKKFSRRTKYLVKWKGYNTLENTWEPVKNLMSYWVVV
jgi:intein/homing endonuclease